MKYLLRLILSHSIFIAICATALTLQTLQLLNVAINYYFLGLIFFATICSYNFYWMLSKYYFNKFIIQQELGKIILMLLASIAVIICFLQSNINSYLFIPAIVLTILYALPLLPFKRLFFVKRFGFLKTIVLSFSWTYVTAILPIIQWADIHGKLSICIITSRFLFMLLLCIIFDNRDIAIDKIRGLHSLATDISEKNMRWLVSIISMMWVIINCICYKNGLSIAYFIALQTTFFALATTYYFSNKKQDYFFYYFIVDGLMLFSAIATGIASFI